MINSQREMTEEERIIWNEGERLIPGVTHDENETKRHSASYNFFAKLIEEDVHTRSICPIIMDLGCGIGFGCEILSKMNGSVVVGIDSSRECIDYANKNYFQTNVVYKQDDLVTFIPEMKPYDYVVSRGVLEHIEGGLELAQKVKFKYMFIFDVPYNEPEENNPHHLISRITEEDLEGFEYADIYYEDINGNITKEKPENPILIMCACKHVTTCNNVEDMT